MTLYSTKDWNTFSQDAEQKAAKGMKTCPICLYDFKASRGMKLAGCEHVICPDPFCQDGVMNQCKECPYCRKNINGGDETVMEVYVDWCIPQEPPPWDIPMPEPGNEPWNRPSEFKNPFESFDRRRRIRQEEKPKFDFIEYFESVLVLW
jgi:hypothetical protein